MNFHYLWILATNLTRLSLYSFLHILYQVQVFEVKY